MVIAAVRYSLRNKPVVGRSSGPVAQQPGLVDGLRKRRRQSTEAPTFSSLSLFFYGRNIFSGAAVNASWRCASQSLKVAE